MTGRRFVLFVFAALLVFALDVAAQQPKRPVISKIFLQSAKSDTRDEVMNRLLRNELTRKGFAVVDKIEDADAILSGVVASQTILFDPRPKQVADLHPAPKQFRYEYELKTRELKQIWKTEFEFNGEDDGDTDKRAARRIAKALEKIRRNSKK